MDQDDQTQENQDPEREVLEPRIRNDQDASATQADAHETRGQLHADQEHDSRVDELSDEHATHQERPLAPWIRPSSLTAPEPRPGMVQRWIRISTRGVDDPRNINMSTREGWTPRPADTVPSDFVMMTGAPAEQHAGRFVVDDLLLCEMPKEIYGQRKAYYEDQTAQQMIAVEQELEDAQVPGHGITKTHSSSVSHPSRVVGRRAEPADDL